MQLYMLISTEREVRGVIFFSCRLISPFLQTKGELKGVIPLCKFTPITTQKEVKKYVSASFLSVLSPLHKIRVC